MTDNFKLKGIASTIRARRANRAIYPASDITQRRPKIVRTAPITMRNGQRTDTGGASPSVKRTSTLLSITPTLFKQVTPAVKAEDPSSSITTKPDTANPNIDADTANVTGHKMDANSSVISSPSGTSLSQDNTRNHVSQVNVSSESAGHIITRRRRRVNRTVRRIPENSAYVAQHRSLRSSALHDEQTARWRDIIRGRRLARCRTIRDDQLLWDAWEEDEDEGYSSM